MALNFLTRLDELADHGRRPPASRLARALAHAELNSFEEERAMIDFELTEEHRALVRTVREFAQGEVAPHIKEWDEKQQFNRAVLDKMAGLGLLGVCIPEEYGGAGFDYVALGLVCEELEAVDTFLRVGHRGAEAQVPRAAGEGREDSDLRLDRAGRGE